MQMASPTKSHPEITSYEATNDDEFDCNYARQLVTLSTLPMVLHAAIELGLFEIIAKCGPGARLSAWEIAAQLPTRNPEAPSMVDRILRLLASYSVVTCSLLVAADNDDDGSVQKRRVYGLASVCKYFLRNKDGVSLGSVMSLHQDKVSIDSWYKLKEAVIEGGVSFDKVHGMHAFDYLNKDRRFNQVFNTAMYNLTTFIVKSILESYKGFENLSKVVDVGGGVGVTLHMITSRYPSIKGVNYDLPHVIEHAPSYSGVEHVGGDMFKSVPGGDAILMKGILHDWTDDHCLKLLKNCYRALPHDGKIIVVELFLPEVPETSAAAKIVTQIDLIMMTQTPGGKERTQEEYLALAKGAGFAGIKFACFVRNYWVMEFFK